MNREDIPKENERVGLNDVGGYDDDIYTGSKSKFEGYHTSLAIDEADVSHSVVNVETANHVVVDVDETKVQIISHLICHR